MRPVELVQRLEVGALVAGVGCSRGASATEILDLLRDVRDRFDVVGFDPRGVGRSAPVDCLEDAELDEWMARDPSPDTTAERKEAVKEATDFGKACEDTTGDLIGHVSTVDVAKDMDVLRSALDDGKLTYLGKSYGTLIGSTYADLFPERVGRMVLDGVMPPDLSEREGAIGQAKGFDTATRAWAKDCVENDCPLGSSEDEVIESVQDALTDLDENPVPASGGLELTEGWASVGIAQAIMHDPPVLVLDEPTDGLDPNQKHGVRRLIREMAQDKAIIISTHILEEVEAICTRAMIIARGRVIADERPDELKRRSRYHNAVRLTMNANLHPSLQPQLAALPGVRKVETVGAVNGVATLLVLPEDGREIAPGVAGLVKERGVTIDELVVEQGRLDDVFRDLTTRPH